MGKKQRQAVTDRLAAIPRDERGHPGDRQVRRRRIRRSASGHVVPDASGLVARNDRPVRRPPAPPVRRQARGARSTTTRISTCRCWRACSIAVAAAMRPLATRFSYRPARFRAGPPMSSFRRSGLEARLPGSVRRLVRDGVDGRDALCPYRSAAARSAAQR